MATATNDNKTRLERLRALSHLLDDAIPIPGTSYRVGLDPLLGLIPGAGDYIGAILSAYIVIQGARMGASRETLLRMGWNILVEMVAGTIPIVGDLFDVAWKANARNIELLESYAQIPEERRQTDTLFLALVLGGLLFFLIGVTTVVVLVLRGLFSLLGS